jgi:NAD(P) transhydrogenase subunit beta
MTSFESLLYLTAAVLFILSLKGLSHPETARRGLMYGMIGMGIAILTPIIAGSLSLWGIILGLIIGGAIGTAIALKIQMTSLPQLVAGFHSLVGLAAVCVAGAAFLRPEAFGIMGTHGIKLNSLIEMSIGAVIGAITFTGSIIAGAKLHGLIGGKPLQFPMQHAMNLAIAAALVLLTILFCTTQSGFLFFILIALALALGFLLVLPIGGADMPVIVSMLNSYSGWAAAGIGFTLENPFTDYHRGLGRVIGGDFVLHHVHGDEPVVPIGVVGRLWRRSDRPWGTPRRGR